MKKLMTSIAAAAVLSTASFASPSLAVDGTGDFLIAPAYFAQGAFETELKVINTNLTDSILVRVVVRDGYISEELDFTILLSPGDVWVGSLYEEGGEAKIKSSDDSTYKAALANGVSLQKPYGMTRTSVLENSTKGNFKQGYVEFYPLAQYPEGMTGKVQKSVLEGRFEALQTGVTTFDNATDGVAGKAIVDVDNNSLAGFVTVKRNDSVKFAMTLPMSAIEGASDNFLNGAFINNANDTDPANYLVDTSAAPVDGDANYVNEMWTLLQKSSVAIPFDNSGTNSNLLMTFWNDLQYADATPEVEVRQYNVTVRDLEENSVQSEFIPISPRPPVQANTVQNELGVKEVSSLVSESNSNFTEGWVQLTNVLNQHNGQLGQAATASFIPTMMKAVYVDDTVATSWIYLPFGQ